MLLAAHFWAGDESLKHISKQLVVLGAALWWSPLQFRQSCWNADLILRVRQSNSSGLWQSARDLIAALVMPVRLQCATILALLRRATSNVRPQIRSDLAQKHEILRRASDALSTHGRIMASGSAREVQEACLRALYFELLDREIREDAVRPMTRYKYATDAMRDLFDFCHSLGCLHSPGAISRALPHFTAQLGQCLIASHTGQISNGRLPSAGFFERTVAGDGRWAAGELLSGYWSENHPARFSPHHDLPPSLEAEYDDARESLGSWSLRAMFCHELAIQCIIELIRSDRTLNDPGDIQQVVRVVRRILHAAVRLSYAWNLPD